MVVLTSPHPSAALPLATPGAHDTALIARAYRESLIRSYKIYLNKLEMSLKLDLSELIQKLDGFDLNQRFSPILFLYYDLLKEGYQTKNLHQIFDTLQRLKNLNRFESLVMSTQFSTIAAHDWEFFCLHQLRHTIVENHEESTNQQKVQMLPLLHWNDDHYPPDSLKDALQLMSELDEGMDQEWKCYVTHIKLFIGKVLDSATSPRFFGAIYLKVPLAEQNPLLIYLRNMVHEISHLHLYALADNDPLTLNPPQALFSSPLRTDKRPMFGIFHATFVLARMVRIFKKYLSKFPSDREAEELLVKNQQAFQSGMEVIGNQGVLTQAGHSLFNNLPSCALV